MIQDEVDEFDLDMMDQVEVKQPFEIIRSLHHGQEEEELIEEIEVDYEENKEEDDEVMQIEDLTDNYIPQKRTLGSKLLSKHEKSSETILTEKQIDHMAMDKSAPKIGSQDAGKVTSSHRR